MYMRRVRMEIERNISIYKYMGIDLLIVDRKTMAWYHQKRQWMHYSRQNENSVTHMMRYFSEFPVSTSGLKLWCRGLIYLCNLTFGGKCIFFFLSCEVFESSLYSKFSSFSQKIQNPSGKEERRRERGKVRKRKGRQWGVNENIEHDF